jgi:hypothetical protein
VRRTRARPGPIRGLLYPAFGPLVRARVVGAESHAEGLVLVDTGASISAVDREIARALRLPTHGAATWRPIGGDPHTASALRRARLEFLPDPRHWELDLIEVADLESRIAGYTLVALLGWDFLDQCKLAIDGPSRTFHLDLPRPT